MSNLPTIHIPAACHNESLKEGSLLVFKTLRVGFPTAQVVVHLYGQDNIGIEEEALLAGCEVKHTTFLNHDLLGYLLDTEILPFVFLDTDIIFWSSCEQWKLWAREDVGMSGFLVPEFRDSFSGAITRERLHTSFLYLNPSALEARAQIINKKYHYTQWTPLTDLLAPQQVPLQGQNYFYDIAAGLYHYVGGLPFTDEQLSYYAHLNCGTLADIVGPRCKDINLLAAHKAIYQNPELARKCWSDQIAYYETHRVDIAHPMPNF